MKTIHIAMRNNRSYSSIVGWKCSTVRPLPVSIKFSAFLESWLGDFNDLLITIQ